MPLEHARSIDALADATTGADIVLSSEAPLTLALDRRVSAPRTGRLAATPRSHASGELVPQDRRSLFFDLITTSDLPWKTAARALDLCLDCWDRTGDLHRIRDYPEFDITAIRTTISLLESITNSYQALADNQLSATEDIRVIDEPSLTPLDRQLLPSDDAYESVSPFEDGQVSMPGAHLYPSATAIVDAVVEQVSAANADQVGIVLDQQTAYRPLLEAALEAEDIPYQGGPGFIDDTDVRVFLRLLQTCYAGSSLTAAEVRPLLTAAGWAVPRTVDKQRIDTARLAEDNPAFDRLTGLWDAARDGTFDDALEAVELLVGHPVDELRDELESLGVLRLSVTERRVNELVYYLQTFEVPVDRDSEGVLLTDAASTAYVDRAVVFYLGLGKGWARSAPDYPWVDDVAFTERDLRRFSLLLQNGRQRYILTQEARAGDEVTPCPYLRTVLDREIDSLADLPDTTVHDAVTTERTDTAFPGPSATAAKSSTTSAPDPDPVETISQSSLKTLTVSPRDYYFDQLVETPTNYYMQRGTVLHDAAELYVNSPKLFTEDDSREQLLDAMVAQLETYVSAPRIPTIRTQLDVGLEVIDAYLCEHPPQHETYDTYDDPDQDNALAEALDVPVEAHICERWFSSSKLGGHGVVDLIQDPTTIVDYKSGSVNSPNDIQKKADIKDVHRDPDFQVLLYLAQHRRERPTEQLEMRFVYVLGTVDEMVKGAPPDLDELVSTLTYVPCSFPEFVSKRSMFDQLTDYADSNDRCKVLDTLGFERYQQFFELNPLPRQGADPDQRDTVEASFRTLAVDEVGDYKYVDNGVDKIFGDLTEPEGYILKDDLDAFETFLTERIDDLNEYRRSRFPVAFGDDEPNWDRVDHRDCILTTDGRP